MRDDPQVGAKLLCKQAAGLGFFALLRCIDVVTGRGKSSNQQEIERE
ncbi:hypothetical protein SM764_01905 [Pseudophaeobacter sp. 1A16562]